MLGKMLGHEFKATGRIMLPLLLGEAALAVLSYFAVRFYNTMPLLLTVLARIAIGAFILASVALCFAVLILSVLRFRDNVLGDQGYLVNTLPVGVSSIILSKLFVAVFWLLLAAATLAASVLLVTGQQGFNAVRLSVEGFLSLTDAEFQAVFLEMVLEGAGLVLLSLNAAYLSFYAAMAMGYGFATHKTFWSFVSYVVMGMILNYFSGTLINLAAAGWEYVGRLDLDSTLSTLTQWRMAAAAVAASQLVKALVFYFVTHLSLKYRLNLE